MRQGVPVIYQGRLLNESEGLVGYPDFLIRHESGQYQSADAKLSLNENKKVIQIQLGIYRRLLANELPAFFFLAMAAWHSLVMKWIRWLMNSSLV